jgi:hypothetical protein
VREKIEIPEFLLLPRNVSQPPHIGPGVEYSVLYGGGGHQSGLEPMFWV